MDQTENHPQLKMKYVKDLVFCFSVYHEIILSKMCDHRHLRSPPPAGIVDHVSFLSDNLSDLVDNSDYSDITLMVENVAFPAHKVILATRSEYFR